MIILTESVRIPFIFKFPSVRRRRLERQLEDRSWSQSVKQGGLPAVHSSKSLFDYSSPDVISYSCILLVFCDMYCLSAENSEFLKPDAQVNVCNNVQNPTICLGNMKSLNNRIPVLFPRPKNMKWADTIMNMINKCKLWKGRSLYLLFTCKGINCMMYRLKVPCKSGSLPSCAFGRPSSCLFFR